VVAGLWWGAEVELEFGSGLEISCGFEGTDTGCRVGGGAGVDRFDGGGDDFRVAGESGGSPGYEN